MHVTRTDNETRRQEHRARRIAAAQVVTTVDAAADVAMLIACRRVAATDRNRADGRGQNS